MDILIYTDGAARGNPGISASGFAIYKDDKLIHEESVYNDIKTNNFAEYTAVILALKWCKKNLGTNINITLYSDSELVVKQLNYEYKVKSDNIIPLNEEVKKLAKEFTSVKFKNVPRSNHYISMVDKKLNNLLDEIQKKHT
ncbi:MAG: ribonuclease HI family protein [Candidatus Micrarchaeia archaeon]